MCVCVCVCVCVNNIGFVFDSVVYYVMCVPRWWSSALQFRRFLGSEFVRWNILRSRGGRRLLQPAALRAIVQRNIGQCHFLTVAEKCCD